eukprot:149514_1
MHKYIIKYHNTPIIGNRTQTYNPKHINPTPTQIPITNPPNQTHKPMMLRRVGNDLACMVSNNNINNNDQQHSQPQSQPHKSTMGKNKSENDDVDLDALFYALFYGNKENNNNNSAQIHGCRPLRFRTNKSEDNIINQ